MIENGFITEGQVVDISQYKLIDFITDARLFRISNLDERLGMRSSNHTEFEATGKVK